MPYLIVSLLFTSWRSASKFSVINSQIRSSQICHFSCTSIFAKSADLWPRKNGVDFYGEKSSKEFSIAYELWPTLKSSVRSLADMQSDDLLARRWTSPNRQSFAKRHPKSSQVHRLNSQICHCQDSLLARQKRFMATGLLRRSSGTSSQRATGFPLKRY